MLELVRKTCVFSLNIGIFSASNFPVVYALGLHRNLLVSLPLFFGNMQPITSSPSAAVPADASQLPQ